MVAIIFFSTVHMYFICFHTRYYLYLNQIIYSEMFIFLIIIYIYPFHISSHYRKKEVVPGKEHSIQLSATQIDSDDGFLELLYFHGDNLRIIITLMTTRL